MLQSEELGIRTNFSVNNPEESTGTQHEVECVSAQRWSQSCWLALPSQLSPVAPCLQPDSRANGNQNYAAGICRKTQLAGLGDVSGSVSADFMQTHSLKDHRASSQSFSSHGNLSRRFQAEEKKMNIINCCAA